MMKNYRFGADYYPEHWPEERWETDAVLMEELGLKVVRMAEFSWHKMEPVEGKYDFDWLEKAVNILGKHGISTVLGTPTAAPPAWLMRKYPEIQPQGPDGIRRRFGGRHHDCQSNETYRTYCKGIVKAMAERFKSNPYVAGWQIDNELGNSHEDLCMCDSCAAAFRKWLKEKYLTVEALNRDWGTCFWSQEYNSFEEVEPPRKTATGTNPSQMLDWKRFHSWLICDFSKAQVDILRAVCPKEQFITHNCMGFSETVSYYDLAKQLDFVSEDLYPGGYWRGTDEISPFEIGYELDGIRGVTGKPFWVMEHQCSVTGWEVMGRAPKPGQISLWAVDSMAHGADTIVFFRWRSCAVGTEQYWHGILPHSGIPGRTYNEIKKLISDTAPVMERFEGAVPKSEAAIIRSYEQGWAMNVQPNTTDFNYYYGHMRQFYKELYKNNISVDFVNEDADLSGYKLVVAPFQYLASEELASKYENYVKNGGHLVLTMRAGVKDRRNICDTERPLPGVFGNLLGISVFDYDPLGRASVKVKLPDTACGNDMPDGAEAVENRGRMWADIITLQGAEAVAVYDDEWYKGEPVVSKNRFGSGTAYYLGTEPDEQFLSKLMKNWIKDAGIRGNEASGVKAEAGVEVAVREKEDKRFYFVMNHSSESKKVTVPPALRLISGVADNSLIGPMGFAIYEEEI